MRDFLDEWFPVLFYGALLALIVFGLLGIIALDIVMKGLACPA